MASPPIESPALSALAAASRDWIGDSPTGAMLSTMRAFQSVAANDASLLRQAADSLSPRHPGSTAWIAVGLGTLVERGAAAEVTGPAIFEQMKAWLPSLPVPPADVDEPPPVPTPDEAMRLAQFQFLCQSVVTHLAHLPEQRAQWGRDETLLERLDALGGYSYGACWVREALLKSSGTLVLLHPESGQGLRLRYANVSNCFHLFTLLQTAVGTRIPGGRSRTGPVTQVDEAWWHYGSPLSKQADVQASIWGEGLVRDIPRVAGEQTILLWPLRIGRAWDAGFLGPNLLAMPADASVERMLTDDESRALLELLEIPARRKRWWPF